MKAVMRVKMIQGLALLLLGMTAFPGTAGAQEKSAREPQAMRIAVVDMGAVFEAHPETAKAEKQLDAEREAGRKEFKEKSEALKKLLEEHQGLIEAGKKEDAKAVLTKAGVLEQEITALKTTMERKIEARFVEEKTRILTLIQKAVQDYNAEAGYVLVLDKSAASANGLPMVVDAPRAADITPEIVGRVKTMPAPVTEGGEKKEAP